MGSENKTKKENGLIGEVGLYIYRDQGTDKEERKNSWGQGKSPDSS